MAKTPDDQRLELLQGTLDMLILRTLQWGPQHGHGIGQAIRAQSDDLLKVETGSLYPALHRLVKRGWLKAEWGVSQANQRAKFYRLTPEGKKQLVREESRWAQLVNAIGRVMRPAPAPGTRGLSRCPSSRGSRGGGLDLDEEDFKDEIRAHLAIAEDERIADGADPKTRTTRRCKEFGNVTLTTEAARRVWTPSWLEALRDLVERRPVRDPRAFTAPGVFAHRHRGAHARDRPERRRVHDAQGHGADPARRRRGVGAPHRHQRRNEHRTSASACRIPTTSTCGNMVTDFPGSSARAWRPSTSAGAEARVRSGASSSPATTFRRSGFARHSAARSCRRTRSRPAGIPSSCSADGLWRRDFGADPGIVGKTVEINNYAFTVVGCRRRDVPRHHRE